MKSHSVFMKWLLLSMLFVMPVFAEENTFVLTDKQRSLLIECLEAVKKMEKHYSNLTMEGTTEYFNIFGREHTRHWFEHFRFMRLGHEYSLFDVQFASGERDSEPAAGVLSRSILLHNSRAGYRFEERENNDTHTFGLIEKFKIECPGALTNIINQFVHGSWGVGGASYGVPVDLQYPFDISSARAATSEHSNIAVGYVKGFTEKIVDGNRVIILEIGYVYENQEANCRVAFYRDQGWAVKDIMLESISGRTDTVETILRIKNTYDFSGPFPKLLHTTEETWDVEEKALLESKVSTITHIDFTPPDVTVFNPCRFMPDAE